MKRIKWGTTLLMAILLLQFPVAALALEVNRTEHLNMEGIERICITAKDCSLSVFPSEDAQAHITSFGDIADSTAMMAASIPEFLAGPPTFEAQKEATTTVNDLEAGTEYVVYAAIGDYYTMATSNDYSGCSFAAVEFTTKTTGGGETPTPPDQ